MAQSKRKSTKELVDKPKKAAPDERPLPRRPEDFVYTLTGLDRMRFSGLTNAQFGGYLMEVGPKLGLDFTMRGEWLDLGAHIGLWNKTSDLVFRGSNEYLDRALEDYGLKLTVSFESEPLFVLAGKPSQTQHEICRLMWTLSF